MHPWFHCYFFFNPSVIFCYLTHSPQQILDKNNVGRVETSAKVFHKRLGIDNVDSADLAKAIEKNKTLDNNHIKEVRSDVCCAYLSAFILKKDSNFIKKDKDF